MWNPIGSRTYDNTITKTDIRIGLGRVWGLKLGVRALVRFGLFSACGAYARKMPEGSNNEENIHMQTSRA
eukprot:8494879-Alexandrium_andersonii.AAC.1